MYKYYIFKYSHICTYIRFIHKHKYTHFITYIHTYICMYIFLSTLVQWRRYIVFFYKIFRKRKLYLNWFPELTQVKSTIYCLGEIYLIITTVATVIYHNGQFISSPDIDFIKQSILIYFISFCLRCLISWFYVCKTDLPFVTFLQVHQL